MWVSAEALVLEEYEYKLNQSENDLIYLQKVLDDRLIDTDGHYGLYCLGLVLGRVLVTNQYGLDWWVVDDEYGRDVVLRFENTSLIFNVIPMADKHFRETGVFDIHMLSDNL